MNILTGFLNLAIEFFTWDLCVKFLYPFFALFFLISVPCLLTKFFRR